MYNYHGGLFDLVPASDVAKGKWWQRGIYLVQGCSKVSDGCRNCWSEIVETGRFGRDFSKINPRWDRIKELGRGAPQLWSIWNDLFHPAVPDAFIIEVLDRMCSWRWPNKAAERAGDEPALVDPGHGYLVLTKRPERIIPWINSACEYIPGDSPFNIGMESAAGWPEHVWVGTSCEGPGQVDRIVNLLKAPVAGRFVSFSPLLEEITEFPYYINNLSTGEMESCINWAIIESESGGKDKRRPCRLDWVRSLVGFLRAAGIPIWIKQLEINGKIEKDLNKFPSDLRIREFPGKGLICQKVKNYQL